MVNWIRDNQGYLVRLSSPIPNPIQMAKEGRNYKENEGNEIPYIRILRDHLQPPMASAPSCIVIPYNDQPFETRPTMIQLFTQYLGVDRENPYLHLKEFEAICGTFQEPNCNMHVVRLKLFSFSLKKKAKFWLYGPRPRSIGTWLEMQTKFFKRYFPLQLTTFRRKITIFKQNENESFYEY